MAEIQYFPSIVQSGVPVLVNGVEVQNGDLALLGQTAGLSDDRVLAELLRLMPTDGTHVARGILPAGSSPSSMIGAPTHNSGATVAPTLSADGSVVVNPFRAFVGSRTAMGTNATLNWRDIRSTIFVGTATTLTQTVAIGANSSGNPRWDLVYAQLTIDAPTNVVQRRVKDPNSSQPNITTVFQFLAQSIQIASVQGATASNPTPPNLPADSGSTYNIPLAYVLVPTGFGPTSTVLAQQIREVAVMASLSSRVGGHVLAPATQNHDSYDGTGALTAGGYAADANFAWSVTSPYRSPLYLPPSMQGSESRFFLLDLTSSSHQSAASGAVLDNSIDWRNRYFKTQAFITQAVELFASDPSATVGNNVVPHPIAPGLAGDGKHSFAMGQSFNPDGMIVSGKPTVFYDAHSGPTGFVSSDPYPSGFSWGIVVDLSTGNLVLYTSGTNGGCRIFVWLDATGQFPNYLQTQP